MKLLCALFAVLAVSLSAWGQAPPASVATAPPQKPKVSPLAEYAGHWTATFDGKIWLRLQLELHGDQLTGLLVHPRNLEVNDNGELKSVSEEQTSDPITRCGAQSRRTSADREGPGFAGHRPLRDAARSRR